MWSKSINTLCWWLIALRVTLKWNMPSCLQNSTHNVYTKHHVLSKRMLTRRLIIEQGTLHVRLYLMYWLMTSWIIVVSLGIEKNRNGWHNMAICRSMNIDWFMVFLISLCRMGTWLTLLIPNQISIKQELISTIYKLHEHMHPRVDFHII